MWPLSGDLTFPFSVLIGPISRRDSIATYSLSSFCNGLRPVKSAERLKLHHLAASIIRLQLW